ncbi:TRAP dicarboxylate transporter, DctM subunit, unknown substrate 3 [Geomicrobium sp. JCM 19037]|nr:TRAP dicarboxylate transporter, DctM subunit, unknown substrate 3 [Geomicrobium sp. JCM 19037]
MLVVNVGLMTPPLGLNVFIVKGIAKDIPIEDIFKGVIPMIVAVFVCLFILIVFPHFVTFLPSFM